MRTRTSSNHGFDDNQIRIQFPSEIFHRFGRIFVLKRSNRKEIALDGEIHTYGVRIDVGFRGSSDGRP